MRKDILIKDVGEIQYQIIYKSPLDAELDGYWQAFANEMGLVSYEIASGKLEKCIKECNKNAKES